MNRHGTRLLTGLIALAGTHAQVLYDARPGAGPIEQGWSYAAARGLAVQDFTGSAWRLITTAANLEAAGYARRLDPPLDRRAGFNVVLRFRLPLEAHVRDDRAGFSLIVLDAERRGIELGVWRDQVFAQADQPLFTRAESALHPFDVEPVELTLSVRADRYHLFANRTLVLTGPLRDYTAFTGFPNVYETPNFIFLGDNTTSAAAEVELFSVALIRPPRVAWAAEGPLTWEGVPEQTYTVEFSADGRNWTPAGQVRSGTGRFAHPAAREADLGFFRVVHP